MNMQAMLKQAQNMQKNIMKEKDIIDKMTFEGSSSFVKVQVNGKKELQKVTIDSKKLEADDIEMLEDMIVVAVNEALNTVDEITEEKLGKYTQGLPGLF